MLPHSLLVTFLLLASTVSYANTPGWRLFYGVQDLNPREKDFNIGRYLSDHGGPPIKDIQNFGLQFDSPSSHQAYLAFRLQYNDRLASDGSGTDGKNFSRLKSFGLAPVLGFDFIDTRVFRLGLQTGLGLTWAELDYRKDGRDTFADSGVGWNGFAGGVASFGYKPFHIFVEAGWDRTSIRGWGHRWDEQVGVHYMDLSGTYVHAGIAMGIGPSSN